MLWENVISSADKINTIGMFTFEWGLTDNEFVLYEIFFFDTLMRQIAGGLLKLLSIMH